VAISWRPGRKATRFVNCEGEAVRDAAEPTGSKAMNFKLEGIRGEVLPTLLLLDQEI